MTYALFVNLNLKMT